MPNVEIPQAEFKVVMLGDTNVGKTSLVIRFAEGYYRENGTEATVTADFITKRLQTSNGITCKVQIWDTAGQERFRKLAPMYYNTAAAAIMCYDMSNPKSFERLQTYLDDLQSNLKTENMVLAIVGTKSDLALDPSTRSLVQPSSAHELASRIGAIFLDTSARCDNNVDLLFQRVAERVLHVRTQQRIQNTSNGNDTNINNNNNNKENNMGSTSGSESPLNYRWNEELNNPIGSDEKTTKWSNNSNQKKNFSPNKVSSYDGDGKENEWDNNKKSSPASKKEDEIIPSSSCGILSCSQDGKDSSCVIS